MYAGPWNMCWRILGCGASGRSTAGLLSRRPGSTVWPRLYWTPSCRISPAWRWPGILVLVVSGYFYKDDPVIETALAQRLIHGFIEKPFAHKEVLAAVKNLLFPPQTISLAVNVSTAG